MDASGGFELCPADVCAVPEAAPKFRILDGIDRALQARLERFLAASGIEVAGIEFIAGPDGRALAYDVNTNTNYNPDAERAAGRAGTDRSGPGALAAFLGGELATLRSRAAWETPSRRPTFAPPVA